MTSRIGTVLAKKAGSVNESENLGSSDMKLKMAAYEQELNKRDVDSLRIDIAQAKKGIDVSKLSKEAAVQILMNCKWKSED